MACAVAGGLLIGLVGPLAGDDKVGLAAFGHQVHGDHGKLGGSAALQKQYLVIVRDVHDLPQKRLRGS